MADALATWEPKNNGLYTKVVEGEPQVVRFLTLDPLVIVDKWGGTKYAFIVYNWTVDKPQIFQITPGVLKQLTTIHRDEDLGPLNKVDVKITATGEMKEKRYTINTMPKSKELNREQLDAAQKLKLEEIVKEHKGRLSEYDEDEDIVTDVEEPSETPGHDAARAQAEKLKNKEASDIKAGAEAAFPEDTVADVQDDEMVDLDSIPF